MHEDNSAGLGELLNLWQIRRLKHRYVNMLDDRASPEELASLFTEDGIWSGPDGYGHHEGREQLIPFFKRLSSNALFTIHMVGNEVIDVTGDAAHGRWSTIAPCTFLADDKGQDFWGFLRYEDDFVRIKGQWLFKQILAVPMAGGPHTSGWGGSVPVKS